MRIPNSSYRLQFTPEFGFRQARGLLPYLQKLGISDIYASPVFRARTGSTHGYDVVNHGELNPELGSADDFTALTDEVGKRSMGWLQDIVPNHMAFDSQNPLLVDLLENGPAGDAFHFFDIDWEHYYEGIHGKVLAPFLGSFFGTALENGELKLSFDGEGFAVFYYALRFPLAIESYLSILGQVASRLRRTLGDEHPDYIQFLGVLYVIKTLWAGASNHDRHDQVKFIKQTLWTLYRRNETIRKAIDAATAFFQGQPGNPESFNPLESLLAEQRFRLSYWKVATEEINYRRFFSINDLISLRMEETEVFDRVHERVLRLVREGRVTGLRVDHIDGLYSPRDYLERLREKAGDIYVVVEKILGTGEELPSWPVAGTSGYDFLSRLNGFFCRTSGEEAFSALYRRFTGLDTTCGELIYAKKRLIIEKHMFGDVNNLAHLLKGIASRHRDGSDITMDSLKRTLIEVMALFPVYRSYLEKKESRELDRKVIAGVLANARENNPALLHELDFLEKILLADMGEAPVEEERALWLHFVQRFQQYTGPLMAKGFEDTLFYVYNRLLSLNEVGGNPEEFGLTGESFHAFLGERHKKWPHALNATATHDTKRGEDVRARLNVLSEIPQEWRRQIQLWSRHNRGRKRTVRRRRAPDRNDEYFLYQTLLGVWPWEEAELPVFKERLRDYLVKAVREAKEHTAWLKPDTDYEEAYLGFAEQILKPGRDNAFLREFLPFQRKIAHFGVFNSLAQTLVKLTAPGVPDFYQGTEFWDLSMVDPDNRRTVDYERRRSALDDLKKGWESGRNHLFRKLLKNPQDGRIKLFVIHRGLQARQEHPQLFSSGEYLPLESGGAHGEHVFSFARRLGDAWSITAVPRFLTDLVEEGDPPLGEDVWGDTHLILPPECGADWQDALTGESLTAEGNLPLSEVWQRLPVALLMSR
jgi:(1->4)-alpha-D-glucan 1-alpha-D-glucosylmutase